MGDQLELVKLPRKKPTASRGRGLNRTNSGGGGTESWGGQEAVTGRNWSRGRSTGRGRGQIRGGAIMGAELELALTSY